MKTTLLCTKEIRRFQKTIWDFYRENGRVMPWRGEQDPYKVLVSEVMLQQTQVARVVPKYESFVKVFPDLHTLAHAPLAKVIVEWNGLGYNRRAKLLRQCAQKIIRVYGGKLPTLIEDLRLLPGVGEATAGSLSVFVFNFPVVFIETNVRSVFIDFFFKEQSNVSDKDIKPFIEITLDRKNPREWYYALMDYGAMLKQGNNPSVRSSSHKTQSSFKGSNREVRGAILRLLTTRDRFSVHRLGKVLDFSQDRLLKAVDSLKKDELIGSQGNFIFIHNGV